MYSKRWPRLLVCGSLLLLLLIAVSAPAQSEAEPKKHSGEFEVAGTQPWIDTGLDVRAGERW